MCESVKRRKGRGATQETRVEERFGLCEFIELWFVTLASARLKLNEIFFFFLMVMLTVLCCLVSFSLVLSVKLSSYWL